MPRKVVQKTSFLGGEAGPLLEGRSDLAQFQLGANTLQNFIVLKGGAITRRPGTRYVTNTLNNRPARLIPFVFSFDGQVNIYVVEISLVAGSASVQFRVIRISDNSIFIPAGHQLTVDSTLINIDEIQFVQSADFLFITHSSFEPQILLRVNGPNREPVTVATAAVLPACTYNNGAGTLTANAHGVLTVDGVAPTVNQRVLVKDQASGFQNGVYTLTTVGDAGTSFVLTRAVDYDTSAEMLIGAAFKVASGTANSGLVYWQSSPSLPTVGTDALSYAVTTGFILTPYIGYSDPSRGVEKSLPFLDENVSATTLQIDAFAVGTGRTLTASASLFAGNSTDVGKWFQVINGGSIGACKVTAALTTTTCTVQVFVAFGAAATPVTTWFEGAWSPDRGFPRTCAFYSQRLVFGGNTKNPDTFWMSKVGNSLQMSNANAAFAINDPLKFTLASQKLNQIRWMVGGKKLTIGTSSSEWVGTVTNDGTNLFVQFDEETAHGSVAAQTEKYAYTIPFIQRSGRTIREMVFDFYSDSYTATDLTLFSSHIGVPSGQFLTNANDVYVKALVHQESPFEVLWALDSVGRLYGLTRDKQQQIAAWHSHVIGGNNLSLGITTSQVTSMTVVPSANGRGDRLWMVVERTVNGSIVYHVEYIDDIKTNPNLTLGYDITVNGDVSDIRSFLDCASMDTTGLGAGSDKTAWGPYARFASDTPYVVATNFYGLVVYNGTITADGSGNITLPTKANRIVIGYEADAVLRLLPMEGGDSPAINTRALKRIDLATVRLVETYGLKVGRNRVLRKTGNESNSTFEYIPFDSSSTPLLPTFTGVKELAPPMGTEYDASFALVMQDPWPCTILEVSSRVVSNEV